MEEISSFHAWVRYHGKVFGLDKPTDTGTLCEWAELFADSGYEVAECVAATRWMATNDPPRYREQHLSALCERLKAARRQAEVEVRKQHHEHPELAPCITCGGTGRVIVPEPRELRRHRWGTCAVLCDCGHGQFFIGRAKDQENRRQLTLADYEREVPHWRDLVNTHDKLEAQHTRAVSRAKSLDKTQGAILAPDSWQATVERVVRRAQAH